VGTLVTRIAAIVCLVAWLPGCSMLFVTGPPADHAQRQYFSCTSSRLAPIADTIFAVSTGIGAAQTMTGSSSSAFGPQERTPIALMQLGMAVLWAASAMGGFSDTSACDDANDALYQRRTIQPTTWAPTATPAAQQPGIGVVGCISNAQCKVGRVCVQGTCMDYAQPPQATPVVVPDPMTTTPAPYEAPVLLFAEPPTNANPLPPLPPPPTPQPAP
jgi:hypothetical protein